VPWKCYANSKAQVKRTSQNTHCTSQAGTSAKRMTSILRHVAEAFPPARQGTILNNNKSGPIRTVNQTEWYQVSICIFFTFANVSLILHFIVHAIIVLYKLMYTFSMTCNMYVTVFHIIIFIMTT